MNFSSIVRKNFTHNFNKYISFYFVNSLIIALLFMYGSLMFNESVLESVGKTSLYETINISLTGLIIFSIVFITYTNMAFLKNRGKEFGMYLTLGMTTKDLTKLIFVENLGIMIASLLTGVLTGTIFGKLFYMGLNKILTSTHIPFKLNYKTYLLSIGVFSLIFFANFIFNIFYIRKTSIIDVIKASKKKEAGKVNILLSGISLILLIIAMICLPKTLLEEIFKEQRYMVGVFIGLTIICPYMVIGSFIALSKTIINKFPNVYNKNILVLTNLSHRFLGYKNLLYMLSLLLAGAMFFVGFSYAAYNSTREIVRSNNPFDIMFIEDSEFNKTKKEDVEKIISTNNGQLEKYNILETLEIPSFIYKDDTLIFYSDAQSIISETNYNKHMNSTVDVNPKEGLFITMFNEKMEYSIPTTILTTMNKNQIEEIPKNTTDYSRDVHAFKKILNDTTFIHLPHTSITSEKNVPFTNYRYTQAYYSGNAFVLDDSDYELFKNNLPSTSLKNIHLLNLKNGDKAFNGLLTHLRDVNGLDNSYWENGSALGRTSYDEKGFIEAYRPVYSEELIKLQLDNNGIMFFTLIFIGLLFVIANGIVLYYKVLSDIEEEKERITSLMRIGILQKELKSIINKELAIIFFVPIIIGGGMGLYYLYVMLSNSGITELFIKKSFVILIGGILIQIIFYFISRRKYFKEIL